MDEVAEPADPGPTIDDRMVVGEMTGVPTGLGSVIMPALSPSAPGLSTGLEDGAPLRATGRDEG